MEFFKAVPIGGLLTYVVALVVGSQGSQGGHLAIFQGEILQYDVWWSWPLFFAGTGLAWGLMLLQR